MMADFSTFNARRKGVRAWQWLIDRIPPPTVQRQGYAMSWRCIKVVGILSY